MTTNDNNDSTKNDVRTSNGGRDVQSDDETVKRKERPTTRATKPGVVSSVPISSMLRENMSSTLLAEPSINPASMSTMSFNTGSNSSISDFNNLDNSSNFKPSTEKEGLLSSPQRHGAASTVTSASSVRDSKTRRYVPATRPGVVRYDGNDEKTNKIDAGVTTVNNTNTTLGNVVQPSSVATRTVPIRDNKTRTYSPASRPGVVHENEVANTEITNASVDPKPVSFNPNKTGHVSTTPTLNTLSNRNTKTRTTAPATKPGVVSVVEGNNEAALDTGSQASNIANSDTSTVSTVSRNAKIRTTAPALKPGVVYMSNDEVKHENSTPSNLATSANNNSLSSALRTVNDSQVIANATRINAAADSIASVTKPDVMDSTKSVKVVEQQTPVPDFIHIDPKSATEQSAGLPTTLLSPMNNKGRTTAIVDRPTIFREPSVHEPEPFISSSSISPAVSPPRNSSTDNKSEPNANDKLSSPSILSTAINAVSSSPRGGKVRTTAPATKPGVQRIEGPITDQNPTGVVIDHNAKDKDGISTPDIIALPFVADIVPDTKPEVLPPKEQLDANKANRSTPSHISNGRDRKVRTSTAATQPGIIRVDSFPSENQTIPNASETMVADPVLAIASKQNGSSFTATTVLRDTKMRPAVPATKPGVVNVVETNASNTPVSTNVESLTSSNTPRSALEEERLAKSRTTVPASKPGIVYVETPKDIPFDIEGNKTSVGVAQPTDDTLPNKTRPAVRSTKPGVLGIGPASEPEPVLLHSQLSGSDGVSETEFSNKSYDDKNRSMHEDMVKGGKTRYAVPALRPGVVVEVNNNNIDTKIDGANNLRQLGSGEIEKAGPRSIEANFPKDGKVRPIVRFTQPGAVDANVNASNLREEDSSQSVPIIASADSNNETRAGTNDVDPSNVVAVSEQIQYEKLGGKGLRNTGIVVPQALRTVDGDNTEICAADTRESVINTTENDAVSKVRGKGNTNLNLTEPGAVSLEADADASNQRSIENLGEKDESRLIIPPMYDMQSPKSSIKESFDQGLSSRSLNVDHSLDNQARAVPSTDSQHFLAVSAKSSRELYAEKAENMVSFEDKEDKGAVDVVMKNQNLEFGYDANTNEKLVIAKPVKEFDDEKEFLPSAIEYDPDSKPPLYKNRRFRLYSLLCCAIALAVIIGAVVAGSSKKSTTVSYLPAIDSPTIAVTSQEFVHFKETISEQLNGKVASDRSYILAENWLMNIDGMQVSRNDPKYLQRFVLALFYFQTSDNGKSPWLSCSPPSAGEDDSCTFKNFTSVDDNGVVTYKDEPAKRWLTSTDECDWPGVECYEGYVALLQLRANGLQGTIPLELQLLPILSILVLPFNTLSGTLAPEIASLKNLYVLELQGNLFEGEIPGELFSSEILSKLDLGNNMFSGTLSTRIGQMTSLQGLFFYGNNLEGQLPDEYGNLSKLQYTRLQRNNFAGSSIPTTFGKLTNLEELWLLSSEFGGTIPTEIGMMTKLTDLRIHNNTLEGTIPTEIGLLVNLDKTLEMEVNQLSGSIPDELYNLTRLVGLELYKNSFTGTISTLIGNLSSLKYLGLFSNQFTGTIPSEIANLYFLDTAWFYFNEFDGDVPRDICRLFDVGMLVYLNADCLPNDAPPNYCYCCTACCNRETGQCSDDVLT